MREHENAQRADVELVHVGLAVALQHGDVLSGRQAHGFRQSAFVGHSLVAARLACAVGSEREVALFHQSAARLELAVAVASCIFANLHIGRREVLVVDLEAEGLVGVDEQIRSVGVRVGVRARSVRQAAVGPFHLPLRIDKAVLERRLGEQFLGALHKLPLLVARHVAPVHDFDVLCGHVGARVERFRGVEQLPQRGQVQVARHVVALAFQQVQLHQRARVEVAVLLIVEDCVVHDGLDRVVVPGRVVGHKHRDDRVHVVAPQAAVLALGHDGQVVRGLGRCQCVLVGQGAAEAFGRLVAVVLLRVFVVHDGRSLAHGQVGRAHDGVVHRVLHGGRALHFGQSFYVEAIGVEGAFGFRHHNPRLHHLGEVAFVGGLGVDLHGLLDDLPGLVLRAAFLHGFP